MSNEHADNISFVLVLHRMPAAKKAKLEKVIKSIDRKKDVLTLECEWASCEFVCNDADSFLVHISHHIDEMMMCETIVKSSEDTGKRRLCKLPVLLVLTNMVFSLPVGIRIGRRCKTPPS